MNTVHVSILHILFLDVGNLTSERRSEAQEPRIRAVAHLTGVAATGVKVSIRVTMAGAVFEVGTTEDAPGAVAIG
ncbi:hypothetical protein ATY41_08485 [Leifsonia xyli subsp. xyli]|uniref:Uncharacterized protein n=1 Tax=Leifsonia xyli subsp. xyli TaxID=59736 RepID=A0A1E2SM15_LEIXY|nr:hypothetical protein ATY41_08485 [Leifsonia xyli subsp. xyli]